MIKIIAGRLAAIVPMLLGVSILAFFLLNASTSRAVSAILGESATKENIAELEQQLGLDRAVVPRYFSWVGDAVRGDLGTSYIDGSSVWTSITQRLPVTLWLTLFALILTAFFGIALGILAARHPGGIVDRIITVLTSGLIALPGFWAGMMLSTWFGVSLGWLPSGGYVPFAESPRLWFASLILPAVALALTPIAAVARQTRGSMVANLSADYVRTARAKGVSEAGIIRRHALRNALGPAATVIGFQVATMIGGSFVIESIFSLPGLGDLTVSAVLNSDAPVLMGVIMIIAVVVLLTNLIVDLLYNYFDPRVREQ